MATAAMTYNRAGSYAYCERLARRAAGNFYPAFCLLPGSQRRAMCALYSFMRIADDLGDEEGTPAAKAIALDGWQRDLDAALQGRYSHRIHPALHHTLAAYRVPPEYLVAVIDGIRMDLAPVAYQRFDELHRYCWRVASAVGLACIHIWGFSDERAKVYAEHAGIAFQMTNILRDLGEDAARQRVYLPAEDLERFGYTTEQLARGERNDAFRALMKFQVERARQYYADAGPLVPLLAPAGQAVFLALLRTYRGLLDKIEACDYDVFSRRVGLSRWRKLGILLWTLPVRWGIG